MKNPIGILAIPAAATVLSLAAWGVAQGQPSSLPSSPPREGPVAPIFGSSPPPATPGPRTILPRQDATLHEREDLLDTSLDDALRDGTIDKTAGAQARMELDSIRYTEDRLRQQNKGELTEAETFRLEGRLRMLGETIRGNGRGAP